eukprot:5039871-Prymnesium_polylepis.2
MGAADACAVRVHAVQCCVRCWACSRGGRGRALPQPLNNFTLTNTQTGPTQASDRGSDPAAAPAPPPADAVYAGACSAGARALGGGEQI